MTTRPRPPRFIRPDDIPVPVNHPDLVVVREDREGPPAIAVRIVGTPDLMLIAALEMFTQQLRQATGAAQQTVAHLANNMAQEVLRQPAFHTQMRAIMRAAFAKALTAPPTTPQTEEKE